MQSTNDDVPKVKVWGLQDPGDDSGVLDHVCSRVHNALQAASPNDPLAEINVDFQPVCPVLPSSLEDAFDDDPTGFVKCIAVATSLIVDCKPPDSIFPWVWISAMAAQNKSRGRVSDLEKFVEAPRLPGQLLDTPEDQPDSPTYKDAFTSAFDRFQAQIVVVNTLKAYIKQLRMIRIYAETVITPEPATKAKKIKELDETIDQLSEMCAGMPPDHHGRSLLAEQLEKCQREKQQRAGECDPQDNTRAHALRELRAWADLSAGQMGSMQMSAQRSKENVTNKLEKLFKDGMKMVKEARDKDP